MTLPRHVRHAAALLGLALLAAGCAARDAAVVDPASATQRPAGSEAAPPVAGTSAATPPAEALPSEEGAIEPALAEVPALETGDPEEVAQPGEPVSASPLDELASVEPDESAVEETLPEPGRAAVFDIPMVLNDQVNGWVGRYSGPMSRSFAAGLGRSGRYMEMFRTIFAEAGLPQDLVYMAAVESGYKTSAYSRAHARGIFQFIAPTARRYGLRVDYWVDDRCDPEKSARAAAAYMKKLYADFGDWHLALAAYNAGEGKVQRAIDATGERDFWQIARTRHLMRETKNHVPAILAAALISKQPERYGFSVELDEPVPYDTIEVPGAADLSVLARCAATDVATLRELNPALRRYQTPPDGTSINVPEGAGARTLAALSEIPPAKRVLYASHRVKRGDTLSAIASRYGVSVSALQAANKLGARTRIQVGQTLRVPTSGGTYQPEPLLAGLGSEPETVVHRVRKGETLYSVARRYRTSVAALAEANSLAPDALLQEGQSLTVESGTGVRRTTTTRAKTDKALTHTVKRGETLWQIANLYRTSVAALCNLNALSPAAVIHPGTRLTVGLR